VLLVVAALAGTALAQRETGSIQGTVTDPSGAVVAGAKVTVKGVGTGTTRESTSGPSGLYNVTNLQPGDYDVTVEGAGFAAQTHRVGVTVGSTATLDVKMAVGKEVTVVEVTTTPVAVETSTQELSTTVASRQVTELPSLTRNPYDFVATSGNVAGGDFNTAMRGVGVSINGARSASTDILLDGGENVDTFTSTTGQQTPLDSVQEFSVITNNFDASYGRASGGIVNVATKAGSNDFHGTLYEFNRVSALTANTYANSVNGTPKPGYTRNQFGGSVGGPIIKNKLFFFGSTELIRVRSNSTILALIADPAFINQASVVNGHANVGQYFSTWGSALVPGAVVGTGLTFAQLFPGQAPSGLLAAYDPTGTTMPIFDRVNYSAPADSGGGSPQNTYEAVGRMDWNITDKTMLYGRYAMFKSTFFPGSINNSPYAGFNTGQNVLNQNFLLNLTHIFTPNLVSQTKLVYNRLNLLQPLGTQAVGPTLYMNDTVAVNFDSGRLVAFPGYNEFTPGSAIPFGGPQNLSQFYEDLSWTHGKHSFKFGGNYIYTRDNRVFGAYQEAVQVLKSGGVNDILALNNFLAGNTSASGAGFTVAIFPQGEMPCFRNPGTGAVILTPACTLQGPLGLPNFARSNRYNDLSFYGMDSWRIHPRLTLNLGLRWEYYGVQHNKNAALDSNFYYGSTGCPPISPGCPGYAAIDRVANGFPSVAGSSPVGGLWEPQYHNFAPRVGFAWDVFGNGKTSLRGGYGISYERNFGNVTFNVIQNPPNYATAQIAGVPIQVQNLGPFAAPGAHAFPPPSARHVQQNIPSAYDQFWSLTIEHELFKDTLLSVGYSGSKGTHLYDIASFNRQFFGCMYIGPPYNCALSSVRDNLQFGGINTRGAAGFSSYHALLVGVRSSNFRGWGLTFNANYTYAHNIDNLSTTFSESANNFNLGYLDPFNPALDKGSADTDARHRFVFSAIWDIPLGKSSTGFMKQVLNGWELAPIYTARTGLPFSIWDCANGFAICNRTVFNSAPGNSVTGNPTQCLDTSTVPPTVIPNCFNLMTLPAATPYADPVLGLSDFGACNTVPGVSATTVFPCPYPANMSGRNGFVGPNNWNLNLGIYKNFKITERWTLQFRNEWYNVFNHHNFYVNGGAAEDDGFSGTPAATITGYKGGPGGSTDERRFVQFALKLIF
jgi:outer membrane receptor protein involved in Fe transport